MPRPMAYALLLAAAVAIATIAGCGGSGTPSATTATARIQEFVGAGYSGEKPGGLVWDAAFKPGTKNVPALLPLNAAPVTGSVPQGQISWYRLPVYGSARRVVITLQPTDGDDSDLYVLRTWSTLGALLGQSIRTPVPSDPDSNFIGAPDWVYLEFPADASHAAGQVAVYGPVGGPYPTRDFRLEVDLINSLTADGAFLHGKVPAGSSQWYRFKPVKGLTYRVDTHAAASSDRSGGHRSKGQSCLTHSGQRAHSAEL